MDLLCEHIGRYQRRLTDGWALQVIWRVLPFPSDHIRSELVFNTYKRELVQGNTSYLAKLATFANNM